jgi:hypothetical protein
MVYFDIVTAIHHVIIIIVHKLCITTTCTTANFIDDARILLLEITMCIDINMHDSPALLFKYLNQ